jgi:pimeloyl-ACP methyl ester carboxylesterase
VSLIGQGDDAPPAMTAAVQSSVPIPLVLLAPPGFTGSELFRLEQHGLAERRGARPAQLDSLDRYTSAIARIVLTEASTYAREIRLEQLMAETEVTLPYNAAFPTDEGRIHFFSAPLWFDRLSFDPLQVLAKLHGPVLVLVGEDDPDSPLDRYLPAVQRALDRAPAAAARVCLLPDRTRHIFTDAAVAVVAGWLTGARDATEACLEPPFD